VSDAWRGEDPPEAEVRPARTDRPLAPPSPDRLWPRLIVAGLLVVVLVNVAFIWIAVSGADDVVPSYTEEER